eukprot:s137_g6.t1
MSYSTQQSTASSWPTPLADRTTTGLVWETGKQAQLRKIMAHPNGAVQRVCRVSRLHLTEGRIFLKQLWSTCRLDGKSSDQMSLSNSWIGTWMPHRSCNCSRVHGTQASFRLALCDAVQ